MCVGSVIELESSSEGWTQVPKSMYRMLISLECRLEALRPR
jgi:hypothetical protein